MRATFTLGGGRRAPRLSKLMYLKLILHMFADYISKRPKNKKANKVILGTTAPRNSLHYKIIPASKEYKMQAKILRRKDVEKMVGLSRSTIYKLMNQGSFPKAIRLGPRAVGWRISDIENWINQQAARS